MSTGGAYLGGNIASSFLNFKNALGANYAEYGINLSYYVMEGPNS